MNNPFEEILKELADIKELIKVAQSLRTEIEEPINVEQAAKHLGFDVQTIYRMVREDRIPSHKKTTRLFFFRSELNSWIKTIE